MNPGLLRLAQMLIMQPAKLGLCMPTWGLEGDPSAFKVLVSGRLAARVTRRIALKFLLIPLLLGPVGAVGAALSVAVLTDITMSYDDAVLGLAAGLSLGLATAAVRGLALGALYGLLFGVALTIVVGVVDDVNNRSNLVEFRDSVTSKTYMMRARPIAQCARLPGRVLWQPEERRHVQYDIRHGSAIESVVVHVHGGVRVARSLMNRPLSFRLVSKLASRQMWHSPKIRPLGADSRRRHFPDALSIDYIRHQGSISAAAIVPPRLVVLEEGATRAHLRCFLWPFREWNKSEPMAAWLLIGLVLGGSNGVAARVSRRISRDDHKGVPDELWPSFFEGLIACIITVGMVVFIWSPGDLVFLGLASVVGLLISTVCLVSMCLASVLIQVIGALHAWRPDYVQIFHWLPYRYHDSLPFPVPGLALLLLNIAERDPDLGKELIAEADSSFGQKVAAQQALRELQARELERAARNRTFNVVADLAMFWLPSNRWVLRGTPFEVFRTAARDLAAGGANHLQRSRALARARGVLARYSGMAATAWGSHPAAVRLSLTAQIWLAVIGELESIHAEAQRESPQIPRVFHAGLPLDPSRPEQQVLFKGRRDLGRIVAHHLDPERRGVLVVVGQRRMGKSSFRNFLPHLLGTGTIVVVADFQTLSGHPWRRSPCWWIVSLVSAHVGCEIEFSGHMDSWGLALKYLIKCEGLIEGKSLLVVIDEVERVEDGIQAGWCSVDFLDFLRAAGDALEKIRFVLLTAYPLPRLGRNWTDRLVSATCRHVSYLDTVSAEELLRFPVPDFPDIYPEGGVEKIMLETGRHPFLLQKVGDELVELLNAQSGRRASDEDLERVLDSVSAEPLFDELWGRRDADERCALSAFAASTGLREMTVSVRALADEGLIEVDAQGVPRLAVPLFGRWIRRRHG